MTPFHCDFCGEELEEYVEFDGTRWHPVCLAEYNRAKRNIEKKRLRLVHAHH